VECSFHPERYLARNNGNEKGGVERTGVRDSGRTGNNDGRKRSENKNMNEDAQEGKKRQEKSAGIMGN